MNRRGFLKSSAGLAALGISPRTLSGQSNSALTQPLRLNANENALGLAPSALRALKENIHRANRYPFNEAFQLKERLASLHGISPEEILLGNGSSEALRLAVSVLAARNPLVVAAEPTFEAVTGHAALLSLEIKKVPLDPEFSHDLKAMRQTAELHKGPVLIYLCNPNNPTGTLTDSKEIENWLESAPLHHHFVIDEAYHHYVQSASYRSLIRRAVQMPNVCVTRTFSKVYAMAGLRLGYLVGHRQFVQTLQKFTFLNVTQLALAAAAASLDDQGFLRNSVRTNAQAKQILTQTLESIGRKYLPSHTNFVMMQIKVDHRAYRERIRAEGILVGRPFPPLNSYNRVTLGLPKETEYLADKLREFHRKGWV